MTARGLPPASLDGSPFRWSMGLHRLNEAEWLLHDDARERELAEKSRLLRDARAEVLVVLPGSEVASEELRTLVVADCERAGVLRRGESDEARARSAHPLEAAARLVQEDLCVLERVEGEWRLVAGCVCFPSRWSLKEKLGASLERIHAPVPGFDRTLAAPAATFFDRLDVARPVLRANWTLLETPELHLPSPSARRRAGQPQGDLGSALWFRVERQTLRRLPDSNAIVFTIRTTVRTLEAALGDAPGAAAALRATLATVPADVAGYKGWTGLLAPLDAWLAARTGEGLDGADAMVRREGVQ